MVPADARGESGSSAPIVVGEEAHIIAEEDNGPRGDPSMPVSERNAYPNLVLLCPTHHRLIDKEHGRHYPVALLLRMKADHEALVEQRRTGVSDEQETRARRRQDLLLQAASASRGRLVARWVAAGVSPEVAQALADDASVGTPVRLGQDLPHSGLIVLEGDFGSGKSVTAERIHREDVAAAAGDVADPVPVYLIAKGVAGSLDGAVRTAAEGLGGIQRAGVRLVLDGLDEPGPARAAELLEEARSLVFTWPNSRVIATARPGLSLQKDEQLAYPPLTDDEAAALVGRLGAGQRTLWSESEAVRTMLRLPLFLIVAVLRQQADAEVPRSQGTFLEALATAAIERTHMRTGQTSHALQSLARLTVSHGGTIPAAELGDDAAVRAVLETRLVVREGRALRFALPIVEQYFAARSALETGLGGLELDDLRLIDRWRDPLTLAVTIGSWHQVSTLLDTLAPCHPGLAAQLVASAVPASATTPGAGLPGQAECARRLYDALSRWVTSLGSAGRLLGLTRNDGRLRTVGTYVENSQVYAGLRLGEEIRTEVARLPTGLHPFTGKAPDGSDWVPLRFGQPPADFMAWPWLWALDWISRGLEGLLRAKTLPLPGSKPFRDERRWQLAKAIMRRQGFLHSPLNQDELRQTAVSLLSFMTSKGTGYYRQDARGGPLFATAEIAALIKELDKGDIVAPDGMLHRPYPAPDSALISGHVGSAYSDQALRMLVEQVHTNALLIYQDLVHAWFPAFAPTLGLASIMPVLFTGRIMPDGDSIGGPDFVYYMEPLPISEPPRAEIRLAATREDLFGYVGADPRSMTEYGLRLRQAIAFLHPGAEGWAHLRSANATLWTWGDRPATAQAYRWLWEDLRELHMVKQVAPAGED